MSARSFTHGVLLPESTRRSPIQEAELSGKKDRTHGNKKNMSIPSAGIHKLTLIETYHMLCHS